MTQITINQIKITGEQQIVSINGSTNYLNLFDLAQLMQHIEEKEIRIISREFHKHNNYETFRNNFMIKLNYLLDNANHNIRPDLKGICQYNFWLIDCIYANSKGIEVIIRNIKGESCYDN